MVTNREGPILSILGGVAAYFQMRFGGFFEGDDWFWTKAHQAIYVRTKVQDPSVTSQILINWSAEPLASCFMHNSSPVVFLVSETPTFLSDVFCASSRGNGATHEVQHLYIHCYMSNSLLKTRIGFIFNVKSW